MENLAAATRGELILGIYAETDTTLTLSDLVPGYQASAVIQSSTNPFRVALTDTTVGNFWLHAHSNAAVTVDRCHLAELGCHDYSQTTLNDTLVDAFYVFTFSHHIGMGGDRCPYLGTAVNVAVNDFRDGVTQTVSITSDNSSFLVSFRDSMVRTSYWMLGDNGDSHGSQNVIENSDFWYLVACENSSVTARNSTVYAGVGGARGSGAAHAGTAEFVAENCHLLWLELDGLHTQAVMRHSTVDGAVVFYGSYWQDLFHEPPIPSSPHLVWESGSLGPGDNRVLIRPGTAGARVSGNVNIAPSRYVSGWGPGSTIVRTFPVLVQSATAQPVSSAQVQVTAPGGTVVWSSITGTDGYAYPEVTFNETNYATEFRVAASATGGAAEAPLKFLSSTPIVLTLSVAYQVEWLPPIKYIEGGYSYVMQDCSTLPIKLSLTDANGAFVDEPGLTIVVSDGAGNAIVTFPRSALKVETGTDGGEYYMVNLKTKETGMVVGPTYYVRALVEGQQVGSAVDLVLASGGVAKGK